MNRKLLLLCVLSAIPLALGGCAVAPAAMDDGGIDQAQVAAVERQASRSGVRVIWVHLPRRADVGR